MRILLYTSVLLLLTIHGYISYNTAAESGPLRVYIEKAEPEARAIIGEIENIEIVGSPRAEGAIILNLGTLTDPKLIHVKINSITNF